MNTVERKTLYFRDSGPQNSEEVLEAIKNRIAGGNIETVVVASTSGETGAKFAEELKGTASVIVVSHERIGPTFKRQIAEYGGKAFDKTHVALDAEGMDDIRKSFYTLGQGFKVAVEVVLIASDIGAIELYKDVVGVGGTSNGADTALVLRATPSREIFTEDKMKKLEIREIIAIPLEKHWW